MQIPFNAMTVGQIFFAVVQEKQRPPLPKGLPAAYVDLMQRCWSSEPGERPSITDILKHLKKQYKQHRATTMNKALSSPPEA